MIAAFRQVVTQALSSPEVLQGRLTQLTPSEWQEVVEVFAARLPEFDAVYGVPSAEDLARALAHARGVPSLKSCQEAPIGEGELVILTPHLQNGELELQALQEARQAGWRVLMVVAAVERTNKGARTRLTDQNVTVRAILQVADTPRGLVFERRTPDRWTHEQ